MLKKNQKRIVFIFFLASALCSYLIGILFYDSTRGIDFNRYIGSVNFLGGYQDEILDAQGIIYFYIHSKSIFVNGSVDSFVGNLYVNNKIQFINFLLFSFGLIGLYSLISKMKFKQIEIFICFSILCFFPPVYYFRLTMKPEVMAFALFPWVILFLKEYFIKKSKSMLFFSTFSISIILTLKASIAGMVILCLLVLFFEEVKKIKNHKALIFFTSLSTTFALMIIYKITGRWLFSKPYLNSPEIANNWNYTAPLKFFLNIDFKNLLENPYKYIHSDSLISITLLDTLGDYFTLFWNHIEDTNLMPINRIEFTDNFLIQAYLPQYISIMFTTLFYIISVFLILRKVENYRYFSFSFLGILILIINSLGFPNKNFDPVTGDLFKVHYYSFLISISFLFLILTLTNKFTIIRYFSILLIPVFLIAMGFPKNLDNNLKDKIIERSKYSFVCELLLTKNNDCKLVYEMNLDGS